MASCTVVLTVPVPFAAATVGAMARHLSPGADTDDEECTAAAKKMMAATTISGDSLIVKAHLPIPLFEGVAWDPRVHNGGPVCVGAFSRVFCPTFDRCRQFEASVAPVNRMGKDSPPSPGRTLLAERFAD